MILDFLNRTNLFKFLTFCQTNKSESPSSLFFLPLLPFFFVCFLRQDFTLFLIGLKFVVVLLPCPLEGWGYVCAIISGLKLLISKFLSVLKFTLLFTVFAVLNFFYTVFLTEAESCVRLF